MRLTDTLAQGLIDGHPSLCQLPPPGLGRAYREFKEKSGDPESEEAEDREVTAPVVLGMLSPRGPQDGDGHSNESESPRANDRHAVVRCAPRMVHRALTCAHLTCAHSEDEELRRSAVAAEAARRQLEEYEEQSCVS